METPPVPLQSHTDLIIIGAGPAGLMAASWASRLKLNVRVLDDKPGRVQKGRADALHVRSLEILSSFGLATPILESGYHLREICSWVRLDDMREKTGLKLWQNPDPKDESKIQRTERVLSQEEDLGPFPQISQSQAFIEQCFVDLLQREGHVKIERNVVTEALELEKSSATDRDSYPITVKVSRSYPGNDEAVTNGNGK
jgi:phenol 2-monooxygenase